MYRASTGIFSGTTVLRIKRNSQKQNCDFIFLKKWRQNSGVGHPLKTIMKNAAKFPKGDYPLLDLLSRYKPMKT